MIISGLVTVKVIVIKNNNNINDGFSGFDLQSNSNQNSETCVVHLIIEETRVVRSPILTITIIINQKIHERYVNFLHKFCLRHRYHYDNRSKISTTLTPDL